MADTWIEQREPGSHQPNDLYAYFGITPPPDEAQLAENVATKRRRWRELSSASSKKARDIAKQVLKRVEDVANALLKGVPIVEASSTEELERLEATLVPVEELWEHIEGLILQGDLDGAQEIAKQAQAVYSDSWIPYSAYGWAVSVGYEGRQVLNPAVLEDGLNSLEQALSLNGADPRTWESACTLLLGLGRYSDVTKTAEAASHILAEVPSSIAASAAVAQLALGDLEGGLRATVLAVNNAPDDLALRSDLATRLIDFGANTLLPLSSRNDVRLYEEIVLTAAWSAYGIPDAELLIRPHLMWSARASTRVFNGNGPLRSLLALFTLFLSPFVHTRLRSRPMWRVLYEGPVSLTEEMYFEFLSQLEYIQLAHAGASRDFAWQSRQVDENQP